MQNNFLVSTKSVIKKVAAITTGVFLIGATLGGAMALDLKDYPSPFVDKGVYNSANALVVGSKAAATDTLGMVDIAMNLQYESRKCVPNTGGISVLGGETESIPLGMPLANDSPGTFDKEITNSKLSGLLKDKISFKGAEYDVHEEFVSGQSPSTTSLPNNAKIATSLTSDPDYKTDVAMEVSRDSLKYYYVFDDPIAMNKTTPEEPIEIKFLGKTIRITDINADNEFTAYTGNEYYLNVDDNVEVDGKKVTLKNVGSANAVIVEVDGITDTINPGEKRTINGLEVINSQVFYDDLKKDRSASLIIGKDASDTYKDGDAYIGEDKDHPDWVWNIGNLNQYESTTPYTNQEFTGPYIGIENDFVYNNADDNPPMVGDCIDMPNDYLSVCMDSLTVKDDQYAEYEARYDNSMDVSQANFKSGMESVPGIYVSADVTDGIFLDGNLNNGTALNKKTDRLYITSDNSGQGVMVFYRNSDNKVRYAGSVDFNKEVQIGHVNYGNTKDQDVKIMLNTGNNISGGNVDLTFVPYDPTYLPGYSDNITARFTYDSNAKIKSLGNTESSEEAGELLWNNLAIGTRDKDLRTKYGIIIKQPDSNGARDSVLLNVPYDQVKANVVLKSRTTSVATNTEGDICSPSQVTAVTMTDDQVGDPTKYNLILVGGPCANPLVEKLFGLTCSGWSMKEGEALIKLVQNGDKVAMLVAGTTALDTQRAAKVAGNYKLYADKLKNSEVIVTGTGLTDITVKSADITPSP